MTYDMNIKRNNATKRLDRELDVYYKDQMDRYKEEKNQIIGETSALRQQRDQLMKELIHLSKAHENHRLKLIQLETTRKVEEINTIIRDLRLNYPVKVKSRVFDRIITMLICEKGM